MLAMGRVGSVASDPFACDCPSIACLRCAAETTKFVLCLLVIERVSCLHVIVDDIFPLRGTFVICLENCSGFSGFGEGSQILA